MSKYYKIVDKTIPVLKDEIDVPTENIIFDEEIQINEKGIYDNDRIRLIIAFDNQEYEIAAFDYQGISGLGGYSVSILKDEVKDLEDLIYQVFILGEKFNDRGYSVAGIIL